MVKMANMVKKWEKWSRYNNTYFTDMSNKFNK